MSSEVVPAGWASRPLAVGRAIARLPLRLPAAIVPRAREAAALLRTGVVLEQADARLAAIEIRVDTLNEEVARMRRGVDSVVAEAAGVRDAVEPLDGKLDEMRESVEPLRRLRRRRRPAPRP